MNKLVTLHFCSSNRAFALGQHRAYVDGVSEKLLPTFENMEEEAKKCTEDAYQRFGEMPGWENGPDLSDFADAAFEQGVEKYGNLMFVKGQLTALATAGIYHLWERTLKAFIARELEHYGLKEEVKRKIENSDHHTLVKWLDKFGFSLTDNPIGEELETCRLISNTLNPHFPSDLDI